MSIKKIIGVVIILGLSITFFILYDNAIDLAQPRKKIEKKPLTETPKEPEERRIYLTILDYKYDTICINQSIIPEKTAYWDKFKSDSSYVITFSDFIKNSTDDNIYAYDMANMRSQLSIRQLGSLALLMRDYKNKKNYKINYVSEINWLKVDATQISAEIAGWDMASNEYSEILNNTLKKKESFAHFQFDWLSYTNELKITKKKFINSAKDSTFKKALYKDSYYISFDETDFEETKCFGIHDLGIVADFNNDGIADRLLTWHDWNLFGNCAATKKSKDGLIEFFKIESKKY